jgi:uncharacterized membrane protein (UPF0127 family)
MSRPDVAREQLLLRRWIGCLTAAVLLALVATAGGTAALDRSPLTIETSHGRFEFQVELAATPAERARGLMFRESLADDHGMLFDFGSAKPVAMWMRNTYIPLDILFIRADGSISRIARNAEPLSDAVIDSGEPVTAVLELRGGLTSEHGIDAGDRVVHQLFE